MVEIRVKTYDCLHMLEVDELDKRLKAFDDIHRSVASNESARGLRF